MRFCLFTTKLYDQKYTVLRGTLRYNTKFNIPATYDFIIHEIEKSLTPSRLVSITAIVDNILDMDYYIEKRQEK